ncbi:MAG: KamA family radical SAM protein [Desulfobacterales bacterium]
MHPNPSIFQPTVANGPQDALQGREDEEPPGRQAAASEPTASCVLRRAPRCNDAAVVLRFPPERVARTSVTTRAFRRKFFPGVPDKSWNDWQWQIRNRIRHYRQLQSMLNLSALEKAVGEHTGPKLPMGITPYYMSLLSADDADQPLRRTVVPTMSEFVSSAGEANDPLGEENQSPVPGLVHRYPDRVLLLVHDFCSTYCRYCTRSRVVGHGAILPSRSRLEQAIDYIRATPSVRDVLLSGGDPLTLNDDRLEWILARLRRIPHVEVVRIGTKIPAVLPQRVTGRLVRMLRKYHPLWMSLHFTHPDECTPETTRACGMLADAGIPLGSQTVLLKGVNDSVATMTALCHGLLRMRVRPYYLYQCDPITGSGHFRTSIAQGLEIIRGMRGFTSGYAVPTYVVDAPGGGGKVPLMPDYTAGREGSDLLLRNYENRLYRYPDCRAADIDPGASV